MELNYLGVRSIQPIDELDTFPAPAGLGRVTMTSDELTALCPVTGQPDFYVLTIEYEPGHCASSQRASNCISGTSATAGYSASNWRSISETKS